MVRAMAPSLIASLGTLVRSGQDRRNLEADLTAVDRMLRAGLTNFRYSGIAIELDTVPGTQQEELENLVNAHQEEVKRLFSNAVNTMAKAESVVDWSKVDLGKFRPEFRHRWTTETSNVSDETLQDLWARLLAGELETPGSVSNDTMSIARDLTKERAEEFQILCSAALSHLNGTPMIAVGCGKPGSNSLQPYGLSFEILARLAHHRLIVSNMDTRRTLTTGRGELVVAVQHQELAWILRRSADGNRTNTTHHIQGILFTPAGKELFAVVEKLPVPEYRAAMLASLEQEGWNVTQLSK